MLAPLRRRRIVVLPDVYTDTVVPLPAWPEAARRMGDIAARGGGNLPVGPVRVKAGGNAANLALALARLGAQVDLVAHADRLGLELVRQAAAGTRLGLGRVRVVPAGSATIALECEGANVMLSHPGPLAGFGPDRLEAEDWALIAEADAVAVVNWAQNRRGTALLSAVAKRAGAGTFLYFDSGDPRHRGAEAQELVRPAAWWAKVGAFGMNGNELAAFTGQEGDGGEEAAAQEMATRLGTRIDLHTRSWAASLWPDGVAERGRQAGRGPAARVKAFASRGRRATGAGDAWNAGNLAGQLLGWDDRERLRLAHRVATLYVTGADGAPPHAAEVAAKHAPRLLEATP